MSSPSLSFPGRRTSILLPSQLMNSEQLTRQRSNISNGGYHGNKSASVPFMWESQPGTPKVKSRENPLPPLSPPPSYYYTNGKSKGKKDSSKGNLLQAIFPKSGTRKGRAPSTPSSPSLSYSSSSASSSSSSVSSPRRPSSHSVPSSPVIYSSKDEEDEPVYHVPQGCYSSIIKKVLRRDFM